MSEAANVRIWPNGCAAPCGVFRLPYRKSGWTCRDELQEQAMSDDRERKAAEAKFKKSERATEGAKVPTLVERAC
jgi:hypothetical protein